LNLLFYDEKDGPVAFEFKMITCHVCNQCSFSKVEATQSGYFIQLEHAQANTGMIRLEEMIKNFFRFHDLATMYCEYESDGKHNLISRCSEGSVVKRLVTTPMYLTFTMEKFEENSNTKIIPPSDINVGQHCSQREKSESYSLIGAVYHCGSSNCDNSWYDAYVKDSTSIDEWSYYDGKTFKRHPIERNEIGKMGNCYMVVYKKWGACNDPLTEQPLSPHTAHHELQVSKKTNQPHDSQEPTSLSFQVPKETKPKDNIQDLTSPSFKY